MARDTPHKEEALRFIEFLFRPDVIERFAAAQTMVPSVVDAELSDDPALQSIAPYFERAASGLHRPPGAHRHPAHRRRAAVPVRRRRDAALRTLDNEWRKVAARTITPNEED